MKLLEYADTEMLAIDLANALAGDLNAALSHDERVLLAVPGGSTPGPVFDDLCDTGLDWSRVDVVLTDERWVPEDHPRSNTRLLRERLLTGRAAAAGYLPLYRPVAEPEEALAGVAADLEPRLPVSVLLLGMGEDMHTASLFPGAEGLARAMAPDAPPVAAIRPAGQEPRLTLSGPVLQGALAKHLVITGEAKRRALERALDLPPAQAPVRAVLDGATVHWAP